MSAHPDYTAAYLHAGNTLIALGLSEEAARIYQPRHRGLRARGDAHARGELEGALAQL